MSNLLCPACGSTSNKCTDSRPDVACQVIRRRRRCVDCGHRFTTKETVVKALAPMSVGARVVVTLARAFVSGEVTERHEDDVYTIVLDREAEIRSGAWCSQLKVRRWRLRHQSQRTLAVAQDQSDQHAEHESAGVA